MGRGAAGSQVNPADYYLRTTLYFEIPNRRYLWLNQLATARRPVRFMERLSGYRFLIRPCPVPDFRHIFAILPDVMRMLLQAVAHFLAQPGGVVAE